VPQDKFLATPMVVCRDVSTVGQTRVKPQAHSSDRPTGTSTYKGLRMHQNTHSATPTPPPPKKNRYSHWEGDTPYRPTEVLLSPWMFVVLCLSGLECYCVLYTE